MKRRDILESALIVVAGLATEGCVSPFISGYERGHTMATISGSPYCANFEGLMGTCQKDLGEMIEEDLKIEVCTTSGNPGTHIELMNKAYESGNPVYILGSGTNDAALAAAKFGKMVRMLIHFDPTCLARPFMVPIPGNVLAWHIYQSGNSHLSGSNGAFWGGNKPERKHLRNPRQPTLIVPHEYKDVGRMELRKDKRVVLSVEAAIARDMIEFYGFKSKVKIKPKVMPKPKPKIDARFVV